MRNGNDLSRKLAKAAQKHWPALMLCALAAAVLSWATWPAVLELIWAVILVVVPVGAAFLMTGIYALQMEEKRRRRREHDRRDGKATTKKPAVQEEKAPGEVRGWYTGYGRERLEKLVTNLQKEGVTDVWIRPDGVCSISTENGYRRRAVLHGYPAGYVDTVCGWIREDRIASARRTGKYLRLSFGAGRRAA